MLVNKFKNFCSVNMISLRESDSRRLTMTSQFHRYGITNYEFYLTERWTKIGQYSQVIAQYPEWSEKVWGTVVSHLEMMRHWYITTDEPYAIFSDDDTDFSSSEHWNFTWLDFVNNLPQNWECVQLLRLQMPPSGVGFDSYECVLKLLPGRYWGVCALMTREYVKKVLDRHIKGPFFYDLRILDEYTGSGYPKTPEEASFAEAVENVLYLCKGKIINFPLFYPVDVRRNKTTYDYPEQSLQWLDTSIEVFTHLWKTQGPNLDLRNALTL